MPVTVNEIVEKITRVTEEESEKTIVSFAIYDTFRNADPKEKEFASILGPTIQIQHMMDKVMIDIIFSGEIDVELRRYWNLLEKYGKELHESGNGESDSLPYFCCTMLPSEDCGRIYAIAKRPIMWSLTALQPGKPISTIRMVFDADDVGFYESDNLDVSDIDMEIAMEESKRNIAAENEEKRRQYKLEQLQRTEEYREKY